MSLARARTQSAQFRNEHTNHEAKPVQAIKIPSNALRAFKRPYKIKCNFLCFYQVISENSRTPTRKSKTNSIFDTGVSNNSDLLSQTHWYKVWPVYLCWLIYSIFNLPHWRWGWVMGHNFSKTRTTFSHAVSLQQICSFILFPYIIWPSDQNLGKNLIITRILQKHPQEYSLQCYKCIFHLRYVAEYTVCLPEQESMQQELSYHGRWIESVWKLFSYTESLIVIEYNHIF